jgi:hypothetical protein
MRGGVITGNIARETGGGVYLWYQKINKTGGTITGYGTDPENGNVVMDESNNVLGRCGHAVFRRGDEPSRKENTAGPDVNISSSTNKNGGWDYWPWSW